MTLTSTCSIMLSGPFPCAIDTPCMCPHSFCVCEHSQCGGDDDNDDECDDRLRFGLALLRKRRDGRVTSVDE